MAGNQRRDSERAEADAQIPSDQVPELILLKQHQELLNVDIMWTWSTAPASCSPSFNVVVRLVNHPIRQVQRNWLRSCSCSQTKGKSQGSLKHSDGH